MIILNGFAPVRQLLVLPIVLLIVLRLLGLAAGAHAADLSPGRLLEALDLYNELAGLPLPRPDEDDLRRLSGGDWVVFRERTEMEQVDGERQDRLRVVGYQVLRSPQLLSWLAALDVQASHSERLTEFLIETDDRGGSLWYQYLDLPWPVRNRHWTIRNTKAEQLAERSGGRIWEHHWQLEPGGEQMARSLLARRAVDGLRRADGDRAIYLAVNRGAWTMIALDEDTTLVAAHTAAVMGGWIPESLVASFIRRQLGGLLGNLQRRADTIGRKYTASYPIFTGSGERITPTMAQREHDAWLARSGLDDDPAPAPAGEHKD